MKGAHISQVSSRVLGHIDKELRPIWLDSWDCNHSVT
jgi:hypothetical protein